MQSKTCPRHFSGKPHCSRLQSERAAYAAKAHDLLGLVGLKGFEDRFPWELASAAVAPALLRYSIRNHQRRYSAQCDESCNLAFIIPAPRHLGACPDYRGA